MRHLYIQQRLNNLGKKWQGKSGFKTVVGTKWVSFKLSQRFKSYSAR